MDQWEYAVLSASFSRYTAAQYIHVRVGGQKVIHLGSDEATFTRSLEVLAELGSGGWEAVAMTAHGSPDGTTSESTYLLKRRMSEEAGGWAQTV